MAPVSSLVTQKVSLETLTPEEIEQMKNTLYDSVKQLDTKNIQFLLENMPPYKGVCGGCVLDGRSVAGVGLGIESGIAIVEDFDAELVAAYPTSDGAGVGDEAWEEICTKVLQR